MKPFAWSHSALTSFETCARRHYLTKVTKEVRDPPGPALHEGRRVHTVLQQRLDGTAPLPADLAYCEGVCNLITRQHGQRLVEQQFAIDKSFRPLRKADGSCDWFSKLVWCRSIVDVGIIGTNSAIVADWKTGKRKPDNDQLALFAAVCFAHYPFLEEVHTVFVWLQDHKVDSQKFTREQIPQIWQEFLPRIQRFELAFSQGTWAAKPSGLCGAYCPVTKVHCEYGKSTEGVTNASS